MSKFDLRKEIKIYSIKSCPDTFTIREFDTLANIIQMNSDDKMALLSALVA